MEDQSGAKKHAWCGGGTLATSSPSCRFLTLILVLTRPSPFCTSFPWKTRPFCRVFVASTVTQFTRDHDRQSWADRLITRYFDALTAEQAGENASTAAAAAAAASAAAPLSPLEQKIASEKEVSPSPARL